MIKHINLILVLIGLTTIATAQSTENIGAFSENDWSKNWSEYNPQKKEYPNTTKTLTGNITEHTVLSNEEVYLLLGEVIVQKGVTLTIPEGTILKGAKEEDALVIAQGAKLIAKGTATKPIVFTSNANIGERKSGDWGGVAVLGSGYVNTLSGLSKVNGIADKTANVYGGNTTAATNELSHVRIEYAGGNKLAALFLGATNTSVSSNIQVSHSFGDGIHVSGGKNTLTNIIAFNNTGDDVDITDGAKATLMHANIVRHPLIEDITTSQAIEVTGYSNGTTYKKDAALTDVKVANVNLVTTHARLAGFNNKEAIAVSKGAQLDVTNSAAENFKHLIYFVDADKFKYDNVTTSNCVMSLFDTSIGFKSNPLNGKLADLEGVKNQVYAVGEREIFEELNSNGQYQSKIRDIQFTAGN